MEHTARRSSTRRLISSDLQQGHLTDDDIDVGRRILTQRLLIDVDRGVALTTSDFESWLQGKAPMPYRRVYKSGQPREYVSHLPIGSQRAAHIARLR